MDKPFTSSSKTRRETTYQRRKTKENLTTKEN